MGRGSAPLHGVPIGVKDTYDTADMTTAYGSPIYDGNRPRADASAVALCRAAGAVIVGKTVTTEFAYWSPGKTRNPRNLGHTPGGSSSGSAAAVADNMLPLAFGSQTAASVIRPAAFCGVFGYKATRGGIDSRGLLPLAPTLDSPGFFTRALGDINLVRSVLVGDDPDPAPRPDDSPPRVGLVRTVHWDEADPASRDLVEDSAHRLAGAGAPGLGAGDAGRVPAPRGDSEHDHGVRDRPRVRLGIRQSPRQAQRYLPRNRGDGAIDALR